jgi:3-hydroxyisobutyrate dehydrogenase
MGGNVAVIGLGAMGYGAANSLLRAGHRVIGCDLNEEARRRFASEGGEVAITPREAASGADAAFVFVVNAAQTEEVLFGKKGLASAMPKTSVVACCATVPPHKAEEFGRRLNELGLLALDAPVSGGAAKAATGEMTVMASGAEQAFARAEPFLRAVATKVYRLGSKVGQGSKVKMINQLLAGIHIVASGEAMVLGIRAGIDPQELFEVISNSAGASWMFTNRVPHILTGDYQPRSAVDIFVKDLGIVLEAGKAMTCPLPLAAAAHQMFVAASGMGHGREDDSAVAKVYARMANIKLPDSQR